MGKAKQVSTIVVLASTSLVTLYGCGSIDKAVGLNSEPTKPPASSEKAVGLILPPVTKISTQISPSSGTYGVALPISVTFGKDIPRKLRGVVEGGISIKASKTLPVGAWVWRSNQMATYRTATFLPANTTIKVSTPKKNHIYGIYKGKVYKSAGASNASLRISRNMTTTITNKTLMAVVRINGKKVRTMPVSMGKKGWKTRSGIKTTGEKYRIQRMTSSEIGASEFYDLQVPYAVRITDSGEFMHAAPWAVSRLGVYNGSHGCTNLSMSNGKWFYDHSIPFDPVITTGTGRPMETWNGPGAIWNIPWSKWKTMSTPIKTA